jgi:hypothetical protein
LDGDAGGFTAAEAEAVVAQADFDGVAEGGEADDLNFLAFKQAHFQEALDQGVAALDGADAGALADAELVQGDGLTFGHTPEGS